MSICIDPEQQGPRLEIRVGQGSPSILAYGWGPARVATDALSGDSTVLPVPLTGREGGNTLWATFLAGGHGRSIQVFFHENP